MDVFKTAVAKSVVVPVLFVVVRAFIEPHYSDPQVHCSLGTLGPAVEGRSRCAVPLD
jgi:hypothetical protein